MKKLWKKVRRGSPARSGEASPKSGSTRGSVASLNIGYEVKEKDLGKLHKAAWIGDLNKVKQLAKKDPSPLDKENRTPLHLACVQGNEHIVQELLEWKARANIGDNQSRTPLMRAVEFQQEGCVNLLLSYHVDIDTVDSQGNNPLHLAVETGNLSIINMLIKGGVSLNSRNKEGFSPLHLAVRNKAEDVCRLLLKERADVNVEDTNLRTPLMYACQDGSISLVKLLLEYNADTVHKDSKGWSADDCAVIQGHHACSQLISDYNVKMSRTTPGSTPRSSSQPPSVLNTPRDKDSIGLPAQDGDDSDNETISKASGAAGSDSWADSPDISMGDDTAKKGAKEGSDIDEDIFDEEKPAAVKISLAKFAKNIHVSESDTDGESVRGPTPNRKSSTGSGGGTDNDEDAKGAAAAADAKTAGGAPRQTSWQSQTSAEDNSWGDSPLTPRKNTSQRVSFKRDEELSEIHDITVTESDAESDIHDPNHKAHGMATSTPASKSTNQTMPAAGYVPSANTSGAGASPSAEKMRALMEELGISDVDDISEMSEGAEQAPPLPSSPPPKTPKASQNKEDSEWDSSVISDIMTTPRPGILKKSSNAGLEDLKESKPSNQQQQEAKPQPAKLLLKAPAIESGDESSAWDTTEAENLVPQSKLGNQAKAPPPAQRDSVSEWDSDLEEMVNPVTPAMITTPTPPLTGTITKELEAIVRQKQAECQDSEDEESLSPVGADGPQSPLMSKTIGQSAKFYVGSSSSNDTSKNEGNNNVNDDDDDDDWDSTADAVTPRGNAGLQFKEVNIGGAASLSESAPPTQAIPAAQDTKASPKPVSPAAAGEEMLGGGGSEESDSNWDSEVDLPSDAGPPPAYSPSVGQGQAPPPIYQPPGVHGQVKVNGSPAPAVDSDEDTETMSSWEKERKAGKASGITSPTRQKELAEQAKLKEQEEHARQVKEQQEEEERARREREEEAEREHARREQEAREEEERQETLRREREEAQRQEELQRQWEREEAERQEQLKREANRMMEQEERERNQIFNMSSDDLVDTVDNVLSQQQELNRIDEQFQRERAEREKREEENRRRKEKEEEETRKQRELEEKIEKENISPVMKPPPPALSSKPNVSAKPSAGPSSTSGVYVNIGSSAVQEIKQRLQIPSAAAATPSSPLTSTGPFHLSGDGFDDDDSLVSDTPGDDRPSLPQSYYPGLLGSHSMYRPNDPLDDDALSYTSTEFEDPVQSTPSYGKDREMLANINIGDPSSLLKVQEYVRDTKRHLEQEKNQRVVLENKLKVANKEKNEIAKKLESLTQQKSTLEQNKLDLEAKIRSLEYNMSEEEEKRKNAEVLLSKTKEQLARKDAQYASELEAKQKAELTMRNLQIEMRTAANTIKELEEEKEELQRQVTHVNNARILQEQINDDQQKLLQQQQQQQHTPRDNDYLETSQELRGDSDKLKAELYALKMEMERQRSRFKDEISLMGAENEELMSKVEDLRNDIKLNEEALAHATMQYNIQVSSLRTDISTANSVAEKERAAKEKLEAEIDSLKTRLAGANQEMDKAIRTRNEIEREYRREKETWTREMDRKEEEVAMLKDNAQHLNQRLHATDSKLNSIDNELQISNTTLVERTAQLHQVKQDFDRLKTTHESLDQSHRLEKEHNAKLQAKVENLQEKLSGQQHENLSLRQQFDTLKLNSGGLPSSDANEKLNSILTSLRADSDRARASLEEKNSNLLEQVARLKEEVRGSETRRTTLEQDLRRLHDEHSDMVKKLSHAEASMQISMRAKEQLEQERAQLKAEIEKLQQRHQAAHDKSVEAQARVSELVDRLEKAEHSSMYSNQQLLNTSASIQGLAKTKTELDESMQQLQIDNARLEAELKYEKQRADMLYQDLQDSQKVRSSLEALCANLKSTSAHLEDRLGSEENGSEDSRLDEETAARVMYEAEARDHKSLYDQEIKSRSKLGLRIADLERNKQTSESKLSEEKGRSNLANEERKSLEAKLHAEMERNQQLQKDVNTLKVHLKSAKNKIKDMGGSPRLDSHYADFRRDVNNVEAFVSTPRHQAQAAESDGDIRAELEAKYRRELNRKLDEVNRFLDSQSQLRDRLDTSRTEVEANMLTDKRRLEEENNNLRVRYEQAVAQRETKEMEAKRFRELYESEMKWRMRISDQLQLATEKSFNLKSKLNNERHHRNRLTGSIGNLNSSVVSNNSFDLGKVNGFHDDELSNKIKAELDRSIAKHLEAAPHDHNKPVLRPTKEPPRFSSSLSQSTHDYIEVLKRKYCV